MHERCAQCGLACEREQGYLVGAIYVSHVLTVGFCLVGFLVLERWSELSSMTQIAIWTMFGIVFALVFFRYLRSLWLSIEHVVRPGSR